MANYWYVVQIYTGHENKVKDNLNSMVEREGLQDEILEIKVPLTTVIEVKDSKREENQRPSYPGYVLVNTLYELGPDAERQQGKRSWKLIKDTQGVMSFLGPTERPSVLDDTDVKEMLEMSTVEEHEHPSLPRVEYGVGDTVKVIDGPFSGFPAEIEDIDMERQRLRLTITIFGRSTPVELGFVQVEVL